MIDKTSLLAIAFLFLLTPSALADTLKGAVKEKGSGSGSTIRPDRVNSTADPFASGQPAATSAPEPAKAPDSDGFNSVPQAFAPEPEAEKSTQTRSTHYGGGGNTSSRPARPLSSVNTNAMVPPQSNRRAATAGGSLRPARPAAEGEDSSWMKLQWDAWHRRVGQLIYFRFNSQVSRMFRTRAPMVCRVTYTVTRDQEVNNVKILQSSGNQAFDQLVESCIKSVAHTNEVRFPPNSQRQSVERSGTFSLNESKSAGFKFQAGDNELIRK